eukprot:1993714-Pyramimonas_sp.AAC.1
MSVPVVLDAGTPGRARLEVPPQKDALRGLWHEAVQCRVRVVRQRPASASSNGEPSEAVCSDPARDSISCRSSRTERH